MERPEPDRHPQLARPGYFSQPPSRAPVSAPQSPSRAPVSAPQSVRILVRACVPFFVMEIEDEGGGEAAPGRQPRDAGVCRMTALRRSGACGLRRCCCPS